MINIKLNGVVFYSKTGQRRQSRTARNSRVQQTLLQATHSCANASDKHETSMNVTLVDCMVQGQRSVDFLRTLRRYM
jgi:hypothetical protein